MNIEYDQFIGIYDDSLSESFCKDVVDYFDKMSNAGFVCHSVVNGEFETRSERDDRYMHLPGSLSVETLPTGWPQHYFDKLNTCLSDYCSMFSIQENLTSWNFKIHSVDVGQGYHIFHREYQKPENTDRVLVYMTYLNTPEAGGETEFLFQHNRCEPKLGRTLIWPAYFTHLHRGNPVLKGRKVYLTGWFNYT